MLELENPRKFGKFFLLKTSRRSPIFRPVPWISCRRFSSGNAAPGQPIHLVLYCSSEVLAAPPRVRPEDLVNRSSSTVTGKQLEALMRVMGIGVPGCGETTIFLPIDS